jgi:two-component system chemotaxis response regulator CheB
MPGHDIIALGASAGGVEATREVVSMLPRDLNAAVFVVMHIPAEARSTLPEILTRAGPLTATHPTDGEPIHHGRIYVAPPNHHLLVERGHMRVLHGPKENRHRPAIDPLFRSAGRSYGPRVVGVVMTGALDDGTAGLWAIKLRGGCAVVQDPDEALYPSMPRSALENVEVDYTLPLKEIATLLARLSKEQAEDESVYSVPDRIDLEARIVAMDGNVNDIEHAEIIGERSVYVCPECQGSLWEVNDGQLLRFRCLVGHAYSAETMMAAQSDSIERALWIALRALEERVTLLRRLAAQARERNHSRVVANFEAKARAAEEEANLLRGLLLGNGVEAE